MDIHPGSVVVATRDGGTDRDGLPIQRPVMGKTYRVTSIYEMAYGLGCTLQGMDPRPYKGYFLHVNKGKNAGWYFKPIEVADQDFAATLRRYLAETGIGERL